MPILLPRSTGILRRLRAFTLIELIVVILVLGLLATIAVVGYAQITDRAQSARAQANLRNLANVVLVNATSDSARTLTRDMFTGALEDGFNVTVTDGITSAELWRLGRHDQAPTGPQDFAVGFDNGDHVANDIAGNTAVVITAAGNHTYTRILRWNGSTLTGAEGTTPTGTTPEDVIADPGMVGNPQAGSGDGGGSTPPPPAPTPAAATNVTRGGDGTVTWSGDAGSGGVWCVDFLNAGTWDRQGCTETNTWSGAPTLTNLSVYWRPATATAEPGFCPSLSFSRVVTDSGGYGVWIETSGVPTSYDWSQLTVRARHYSDGVLIHTDPNVYASPDGWLSRVLFAGGSGDPSPALVYDDVYEIAISGPGLYDGCSLAFTLDRVPDATIHGWANGDRTAVMPVYGTTADFDVTQDIAWGTTGQVKIAWTLSGPLPGYYARPDASVIVTWFGKDPTTGEVVSASQASYRVRSDFGTTGLAQNTFTGRSYDRVEIRLETDDGQRLPTSRQVSETLVYYPAGHPLP